SMSPGLSTAPATSGDDTLSLHDALPISGDEGIDPARLRHHEGEGEPAESARRGVRRPQAQEVSDIERRSVEAFGGRDLGHLEREDRKSTRLNSSHVKISYAVCCLKKKKI